MPLATSTSISKSPLLQGSGIIGFSSEKDLYPRLYSPLSRDDLLNCLVTGMQILALGLQSLAAPLMRAAYGDEWLLKECQLPRDYLWKDVLESDVHFDLEGIMFVLVSSK